MLVPEGPIEGALLFATGRLHAVVGLAVPPEQLSIAPFVSHDAVITPKARAAGGGARSGQHFLPASRPGTRHCTVRQPARKGSSGTKKLAKVFFRVLGTSRPRGVGGAAEELGLAIGEGHRAARVKVTETEAVADRPAKGVNPREGLSGDGEGRIHASGEQFFTEPPASAGGY